MTTAKKLALISVFTALLVGCQFALSFLSGVEVVTVLFLTFAFTFGIKPSLLVATAFSLLRCFIFGFFPSVIALYLIYYNLFAVVVGSIGNKTKGKLTPKTHLALVGAALLLTLLFTLLDDVITPIFYSFTWEAAVAYAYASLTLCIPQTICAVVTVGLLFPALHPIFKKFQK